MSWSALATGNPLPHLLDFFFRFLCPIGMELLFIGASSRALQRVVGPDLSPDLVGEGGKRQDLLAGIGQQLGRRGEALLELLDGARVLGAYLLSLGSLAFDEGPCRGMAARRLPCHVDDFKGQADIVLGRTARPGESYVSTGDAFAPGEVLYGSGLVRMRVSAALIKLKALGLSAEWRDLRVAKPAKGSLPTPVASPSCSSRRRYRSPPNSRLAAQQTRRGGLP